MLPWQCLRWIHPYRGGTIDQVRSNSSQCTKRRRVDHEYDYS